MKLIKISIENFLSISHAKIAFPDTGIVMIKGETPTGSNGAGKSSLTEAIYWTLFGKTIRDITDTGVVRFGATKVRVVLEFIDSQGRTWIIDRQRGKSKGQSLSVSIDGKTHTYHSAKDDQLISQVVVDSEIFALTSWFGKRYTAFCDMRQGALRDVLDRIIGTKKWDKATMLAHDLHRTKKERLNFSLETLEQHRHTKRTLSDQYQTLTASVETLQDAINSVPEKSLVKVDVKKLKTKIDHFSQKLEKSENLLQPLREDLQSCILLFNKYVNTINIIYNTIKNKNNNKKHTCPTCKLEVIVVDNQENKDKMLVLTEKLSEQEKLKSQTLSKKDKISAKIAILINKNADFKRKMANYKNALEEAENVDDRRQKKIADLMQKKTHTLAQVQMRKKDLQEIKTKITEQKQKIAKLEKIVEAYHFWKKGFTEIRRHSQERFLNAIAEQIQNYCRSLGLDSTGVEFSMPEKSRLHSFIVRADEHLNIQALSEGETMRFNLAAMFAMRSFTPNAPAFLVLDEPFSGIDKPGRDNLIEVLRTTFPDTLLIVIDHDDRFPASADKIITIKKTANGATIC